MISKKKNSDLAEKIISIKDLEKPN